MTKRISWFGLSLMFMAVALQLQAQDENFFGMVLIKEGEVLLTRGIMEFPAKIEDSLQYGDEIETGENGRVQISFKSSFISVGPNSYFSIEQEKEDNLDITILALEEGAIRSRIIDLDPDERYHIQTETGTVVVTGTDFVTSVGDDSGMNVSVLKGSIDMVSADGGKTQPVGTMESLAGTDGGMSSAPLQASDVSQIKAALPVPTDQTEGMALLPEQGGDVSIDLVAIDSITQGIDPVAPTAPNIPGFDPQDANPETTLSNDPNININDPDILPPEVILTLPGFGTPGQTIDPPGGGPPTL